MNITIKMNNRAFLRLVEAVIAILIVASVLLVIAVNNRPQQSEEDLSSMIPPLLEEIAQNNSLREKIVSGDPSARAELLVFLEKRIDEPWIIYNVSICNADETCFLDSYPSDYSGEIYTRERIISTILNADSPAKKVKIFLWKKE